MSNNTYKRSYELREVRWGVCVYLLDGALTIEEIKTSYNKAPFPFSRQPGFYVAGQWNAHGLERLPDDLAGLLKAGWVIQEDDRFALTERGRERVNRFMKKAQFSSDWVNGKLHALSQPEVASKVTLIIQLILALIKLPAGLLSGSVGLLNDSADTILDLLSSLLVCLGLRFNKERLVSILLVISMLATGGFTLYEAVHRFLTPYVPQVDWFPFAAAALSALVGLALWTYQRYIGIRHGLMAFIAESVDSRNHVIVALGVTTGLAASLLRIGLVDMLVGLVVAILILWSAIQLAIDLVRSSGSEQVNCAHYRFWLQSVYEHVRNVHLRDWMLYLVSHEAIQTRNDLMDRARQAFDFRGNPWMKLMGLDRQFASDMSIEQSLNELFSRGWVVDQEPLICSEQGKEYLKQQNRLRRTLGNSNNSTVIGLPAA
ncbi:MAG TPA: cation transporter [Anaerolineae bacterium]|nr:cation transporter [Anaerolineae bacterium]